MSNLSKETLERIEKDAEVYGEEHQDHLYNVKGYSTYNDLVSGYNAGALHEVERAQGVIYLLDEARLQIEYLHKKFGETGSGNNVLARIETELAKYKEVNA
jgi:hypothetical protein